MKGTLDGVNAAVWQWGLIPLVLMFGLWAGLRTRFFQVRCFPRMLKETAGRILKKEEGEGSVTPFQALCTALAGTVGTGSVVGTCQALAVGGPGALFWMLVAAFLGMLIKFCEVVLALCYRRKSGGEWVGGPMYYILDGMGKRWKPLAVLFALFALLSSLGMGCMAQVKSITDGVGEASSVLFPETDLREWIPLWVGIFLVVFLSFALYGGAERVGRITVVLVPFACALFFFFTVGVLWFCRARLGETVSLVVRCAFSGKALLGGTAGIGVKKALEWGMRRSAFSNEAGLGSAAIAHASAKTSHPVAQGLFGMFEVFVDTLVVCTLTGLCVLVSLPTEEILRHTMPDSTLIIAAVSVLFGSSVARAAIGISLALFAFSTLVGWSLYGARCARFLMGRFGEEIYRILYLLCAFFGAVVSSAERLWSLSDLFNGLMAVPNFIALFALFPSIPPLIAEYFSRNSKKS